MECKLKQNKKKKNHTRKKKHLTPPNEGMNEREKEREKEKERKREIIYDSNRSYTQHRYTLLSQKKKKRKDTISHTH